MPRSRSPLWVRWHVAALTLPRELPPSQLERQSRRLPRHRKPLWKFQNLKFQQWGAANCGSESCGQGRSAVDNAGRPIRGFWNSGIDTTHRARSAGFRDFSGGGDSAVVAAGSGSGPITTSGKKGPEDSNAGRLNVRAANAGRVRLVGGCAQQ